MEGRTATNRKTMVDRHIKVYPRQLHFVKTLMEKQGVTRESDVWRQVIREGIDAMESARAAKESK